LFLTWAVVTLLLADTSMGGTEEAVIVIENKTSAEVTFEYQRLNNVFQPVGVLAPGKKSDRKIATQVGQGWGWTELVVRARFADGGLSDLFTVKAVRRQVQEKDLFGPTKFFPCVWDGAKFEQAGPFQGEWSGSYKNSKGDSQDKSSISFTKQDWDGYAIQGFQESKRQRQEDGVWVYTATWTHSKGGHVYNVEATVVGDVMTVHYTVQSEDEHYSGDGTYKPLWHHSR